jgi:predicted deacylase
MFSRLRIVSSMTNGLLSHIEIGRAGVVSLDIPLLTFGGGSPRLGIIAGVHGNEQTGQFVIAEVLREIEGRDLVGTLRIVPVANPLAHAVGVRRHPVEHYDLNRAGFGHVGGSATARTAAALVSALSDCDLVIDLHEFSNLETPVMCACTGAGAERVRSKSQEAIRVFAPEVIWATLPENHADRLYEGLLLSALAEQGIAGFAVEQSGIRMQTHGPIEAAMGILRVMDYLGMIDGAIDAQRECGPVLSRREVTFENAGLWWPHRKLMAPIRRGQSVGRLSLLPNFASQDIVSPLDGVILQIRPRGGVSTGAQAFSVGQPASL